MTDYQTIQRQQGLNKIESRTRHNLKNAAILVLIFIAFGVVGRMDYEDEVAKASVKAAATAATVQA